MNINDISKNDYELTAEYPEVPDKLNLSSNIISKIINEYVGNKSEFTSISQYIYQAFLFKRSQYPKLYEPFKCISIREMHHLEILSQILIASGMDPKFRKCIDNSNFLCSYWSSQNVDFTEDIIGLLKSDITLENKAIMGYKNIISESNNKNLNNILERILKDEYKHLEFFTELLKIFESRDLEEDNDEILNIPYTDTKVNEEDD